MIILSERVANNIEGMKSSRRECQELSICFWYYYRQILLYLAGRVSRVSRTSKALAASVNKSLFLMQSMPIRWSYRYSSNNRRESRCLDYIDSYAESYRYSRRELYHRYSHHCRHFIVVISSLFTATTIQSGVGRAYMTFFKRHAGNTFDRQTSQDIVSEEGLLVVFDRSIVLLHLIIAHPGNMELGQLLCTPHWEHAGAGPDVLEVALSTDAAYSGHSWNGNWI